MDRDDWGWVRHYVIGAAAGTCIAGGVVVILILLLGIRNEVAAALLGAGAGILGSQLGGARGLELWDR